ncbi:MAG: hypothetical protein U0414_05750 [Polyangiaceae bacterium]
MAPAALTCAALSLLACDDDATVPPAAPTKAVFDLSANLGDAAHFFDVPYPSDLRISADAVPKLDGFPNPKKTIIVQQMLGNAKEAHGFPVVPVAHFLFDHPLKERLKEDVIAADKTSPVLLLNIDPTSPEHGKLIPTIAATLPPDDYTPENLLAVAPRPGFVLRPHVGYAIIVMKSIGDAAGKPLGTNDVIERLRKHTPASEAESNADPLYTYLWDALAEIGVDSADVATATVFSTGGVVEELNALGDKVKEKFKVTLDGLTEVTDPKDQYPEFCYLKGKVTYPQFQNGTPPFNNTGGHFEFDADGTPKKQRDEDAPIILLVPKTPMPAKGYPILFNIHGSGGYSVAAVRPVGDDGNPGDPIGPAFVVAKKGIAVAGSAMPLNPERYPGASETQYINSSNIAAMRDTFRQGAIEQRLFIEAVKNFTFDPALLGACGTGPNAPSLPNGETKFKFDTDLVLLTGQSMGGMYTNIIGATEPSVKAVVPTGAGGYWTHFFFYTPLQNGAFPGLLGLLIESQAPLSHLHPVLALGEAGLEAADPIVYMPHLARRPLPGHPVRPIYRPVGIGDSYFPTQTYDAVAIAYGHKQAGDEVWPEMQDALELAGVGGILPYPIENDMMSDSGVPYTGVVAQYEADGDYDPHALYSHHEGVKHQYGCFWESFIKTGVARVPPPTKPSDAPCE